MDAGPTNGSGTAKTDTLKQELKEGDEGPDDGYFRDSEGAVFDPALHAVDKETDEIAFTTRTEPFASDQAGR